ncbi:MAG: hypothetical protein JSR55_00130 [Proteobacteria bacterium]|nr:hypothetical protein [Pseudomonadota bacterium]
MFREILLGAVFLCAGFSAAFADDGHVCHLTPDEKIANAKLSFDDFDQKGTTSSTWRGLMKADCPGRAAEAADDYLVNGPMLTPDQKSDVLFHEAQALAIMGDNAQASRLVSAAIPPDRGMHGDLDWTTYLTGTWAFLVKDRATLDAASSKMAAEPGDSNRIDAAVLRGLQACFDKDYDTAYNDCRPK